jgi:hypothetical protein
MLLSNLLFHSSTLADCLAPTIDSILSILSSPALPDDLLAACITALSNFSRCGEKQREMMARSGVAEVVAKFAGRAAVRGGVRKLVKSLLRTNLASASTAMST